MKQIVTLLPIILIFTILSVFLLMNHEPWRDEAQAWLIARDSPNIESMISLMGYEGTPALWHFILYSSIKLGLPYSAMSVIHFLLAFIAIILFLGYAPFTKLQKILFVFSYYVFYEYNIIARHYVFFQLFLFLIALVYKERFKKPLLYAFIIALMANSSLQGLVVASFLTGLFVYNLIFRQVLKVTKVYFISFLIIASGFCIAIYQISPPPDLAGYLSNWNVNFTAQHFSEIGKALVDAFLPIPQFRIDFWNKMLINGSPAFLIISGIVLYLLSLAFFIKKPKALLMYLIFSGTLMAIIFLKIGGCVRHHGPIFIVFIFSLWLSKYEDEKILIDNALLKKLFNPKILNYLLIGILILQAASSSIAFYYDMNYDFSSGKRAAAFLKDHGFINDDSLVATYYSYSTSPILPYISSPNSKFYLLEYRRPGSFMIWNKEYESSLGLQLDELISRVDDAISIRNYSNVLLILNGSGVGGGFVVMNPPLKGSSKPTERYRYELIACFEQTIVADESIYIYKKK